MFSFARSYWFLTLPLVALGVLGCNPNIEQNAAFQEQASRLERLEEDLKATSRQVSSLDAELQPVSKDVAQLLAKGPGAGGDAYKALEQRLVQLEQRVNELANAKPAKNVAEVAPAAKAAEPKQAQAPADAADADAAPQKSPAKASLQEKKNDAAHATVMGKASLRKKSRKARMEASAEGEESAIPTKRTRVRAESSASAAPSGTYYQVRQGESLEQIAAKRGVSASAIMKANRLPASATLVAGQTLFIPGK